MKASIIIPCRDAGKTISSCLDAVLAQKVKFMFEVIVVENRSSDDTQTKLKSYEGRCNVICCRCKNAAAARNIGLDRSKGDIIVFLDADCIPAEGWLKNLLMPFDDKRIIAVGGKVASTERRTFLQRYYDVSGHRQDLHIRREMPFIATANMAVRRDRIIPLRFDETMAFCEDNEFFLRLLLDKDEVHYEASALVMHHYDSSYLSYLRKMYRYGYWLGEIDKRKDYKVHNLKISYLRTLEDKGFRFTALRATEAVAFRFGLWHSWLS